MSILSGNEISIQQKAGGLYIEDFDHGRLGPNSYNLRLADRLLVYDEVVLDPRQVNRTREIKIPSDGYVLRPGRVYLGRTMERTTTRDYVPMLVGRSSVGRLGVSVHVTAGFGDVGFAGTWTLELTAEQPVRIYPGMEICQIYYETIEGEVLDRYHGKYQGQVEPTASRIWKEME